AADHQAGALQRGEMGRNSGLRKPGPLVDLPGTYAVFQRMELVGEVTLRLFQPSQDFPPQWMGNCLDDFVEVVGHGVSLVAYIVMGRTIYRHNPIQDRFGRW